MSVFMMLFLSTFLSYKTCIRGLTKRVRGVTDVANLADLLDDL